LKKFLFLFLIFAVCTGAFPPKAAAQFSWRFDADLLVKALAWNIPTGERAEKFITVGDDLRLNTASNNPANSSGANLGISGITRGDYTYTSGTLDFFNGSNTIASISQSRLRLYLWYRGQNVNIYTLALLDQMAQSVGLAADEGHSFVQGNGGTAAWLDFLRRSFEEWYISGRAGIFTGFIGSVSDYGKVNLFLNFTDNILQSVMSDAYGVNTPIANSAAYNVQHVNNLARSGITRNAQINGNFDQNRIYSIYTVPYLAVSARVNKFAFPLTFQIAADPGDNNMTGAAFNFNNYSGMFRVSGENIADRITFDVIYKFRGGDPDTLDSYDDDNPGGTLQPDGMGFGTHQFGVYANILNVPNLGIGLSYSGWVKSFEDTLSKTTEETTTKSGPLFSGIELRLQYTGIPNSTLTLHNNVSFAHAGKRSDTNTAVGVWGTVLPVDTEQDWFALYNALGYTLRLSSQFTFTFQIAHRMGIVTTSVSPTDADAYEVKRTYTLLGGGGLLNFQFNRNLLLQTGIGFRYEHNSYSNSAVGAQDAVGTRDASGGTFGIAIPIRMRIYFRP